MKNNLFFVASDYDVARKLSKRVAVFFDMRIFDSIEMFEFDHTPRKINEVFNEFGESYIQKQMRSIVKMQLDFSDSVFVFDSKYLSCLDDLYKDVISQNLVIFLNNKNNYIDIKTKINLLTNCCDIAVDATNIEEDELFENILSEIKTHYNLGG